MPLKKIIKKYWRNGCISFFLLTFVFIYLVKLSWLKWGDLIIDFGREADAPLQILSGKIIYRDFCYFHGPFSPYLNAFLFKLFGVNISSLVICGMITAIAASLLIYKICRFFFNVFFSTFTVLTFLIVFAFGQYLYLGTYNFILPFSYDAVHSIVFAMATIFCFCTSIVKEKIIYLYLSSFFMALTLLAKFEIAISLFVSIVMAIIFYTTATERKFLGKRLFYRILICIAFPILLAGPFYLFLWFKGADLNILFFNLLSSTSNVRFPFPRWLSGMQNLTENLGIFFKAFLNYLILSVVFILGGSCVKHLSGPKRRFLRISLALFFITTSLVFLKYYFPFQWQYRPLPLFLLVIIFASATGSLRAKEPQFIKENIMLLLLSVFSFLILVRMIFFVRAGHYGFYLLIPGMIIYYVFFLKFLPGFFVSKESRFFFKAGFLCVFIFFIFMHLNISKFCYVNKKLKISFPRGTLYTFNTSQEINCRRLIEYLRENTKDNESLVVFPEGLLLNFLSQRRDPISHNSYLPADLTKAGVTESLLEQMELYKVDYVVINQRDVTEFGYRAFGKDYAQDIGDYINKKYELIKQFGPFPYTTQEFGIALFKRRGEGAL